MKKTILFLILVLALSCRKEFNYDFQHIQQVNISAFIVAGDTLKVRLSFLKNIYTGTVLDDKDYIKNADVYLYEDNIFKEKLIYKEVQQSNFIEKGWYFSQTFLPSENHRYMLKVFVSGYDTLYAETYIPTAIKIDSLQINGETSVDTLYYSGNDKYSVNLFFKDEAGEANYYNFSSGNHFISYDPAIEPRYRKEYYETSTLAVLKYAFFSDEIFDGHQYALNSEFNIAGYFDFQDEPVLIDFKLYSLSYDAYAFYKSRYLYYKTLENPLSEPVIIYSNVKNGTGLFAGMSYDVDSVKIFPPQN